MTMSPQEEYEMEQRASRGEPNAQLQLDFHRARQAELFQHAQASHQGSWPEHPMLPRGCVLYIVLIMGVAFGVEWIMQAAIGGIGRLLGEEAARTPQGWLFETGRFLVPLLALTLGVDWLLNRGLNGRNLLRVLAIGSLALVGLTFVAGLLAAVL